MSVLILGKGGREHAIIHTLISSNFVEKIFVINDSYFKNPIYKTEQYNKIENIVYSDELNHLNILDICTQNSIKFIIPGPEIYLVNGLKDFIEKNMLIEVFGPSKYAAQIEGSKYFAKQIMGTCNIPTSPYYLFENFRDFHAFYQYDNEMDRETETFTVVKANGLAGGKGVLVSKNIDELIDFGDQIFNKHKFGENQTVIVEEMLYGQEISVLGFCNGNDISLMPCAQDYKKIYDQNKGPNTGGMGSICPVNILTEKELSMVREWMRDVVKHLQYVGVLYAGLMKTSNGLFMLEFNCRFGDPETQSILPLLDSDLFEIITKCTRNQRIPHIKWKSKFVTNVVLSHTLYPNKKLQFLTELTSQKNTYTDSCYFLKANVSYDGKKYLTNGGRVGSIVSIEDTLEKSIENAYNKCRSIDYKGIYYRRDIGRLYLLQYLRKNKKYRHPKICVVAKDPPSVFKNLLDDTILDIELVINLDVYNEDSIYNTIYLKDTTKIHELLRVFDIDMIFVFGKNITFTESLIEDYKSTLFTIDDTTIYLQDKLVYEYQNKNMSNYHGMVLSIEDFVTLYQYKPLNYKVDIEKGNELVEIIKKDTPEIGGFCSINKINQTYIGSATDGIGTKLELALKYNQLNTIGTDLVAMCVNDLYVHGVQPKYFLDYIAIDRMDVLKTSTIVKSIKQACESCNIELVGGETAEMHGIYRPNKCDVAGFSFGDKCFDIDTNQIRKDCYIYGIPSSGVHSNGYTLINSILKQYSNNEKEVSDSIIQELLKPTRIYSEILNLLTNYHTIVCGLAHITGGGFKDNIQRILPKHLSFEMLRFELPPIFKWIQDNSGLSYNDMLQTYNCGYGMVVILKDCNQSTTLEIIKKYNLHKIGYVV